jgi:hypothetical protein
MNSAPAPAVVRLDKGEVHAMKNVLWLGSSCALLAAALPTTSAFAQEEQPPPTVQGPELAPAGQCAQSQGAALQAVVFVRAPYRYYAGPRVWYGYRGVTTHAYQPNFGSHWGGGRRP